MNLQAKVDAAISKVLGSKLDAMIEKAIENAFNGGEPVQHTPVAEALAKALPEQAQVGKSTNQIVQDLCDVVRRSLRYGKNGGTRVWTKAERAVAKAVVKAAKVSFHVVPTKKDVWTNAGL